MQFYKVTAMLDDSKWIEENNSMRVRTERTRQIATGIDTFNRQNNATWAFVSDIGDCDITCGLISTVSDSKPASVVNNLLNRLHIKATDYMQDETTLLELSRLLRTAERNGFIENDEDVLAHFNVCNISYGSKSGIDFGEKMLDPDCGMSILYKNAEKMLATQTLVPELDRIYAGKTNAKVFGHPVHYFVEADNRETRKSLYKTLLQGLYNIGRLRNLRYCFVDFGPGAEVRRNTYDELYQSCIDGAVVVRYIANDDSEDSDYAGNNIDTISALCETMVQYRNRVLTVFCLPRSCEKVKKQFIDNLGPVGMVSIREDLAGITEATDYLKMMCRDSHLRYDKRLLSQLEDGKQYYPDELHVMFDEWYNNKIKTTVYPQYKDVQVCRKEAIKEVKRGSSIDELEAMIGLHDAKSVINKVLSYFKIQRVYQDRGLKADRPAMHMVFSGNPGTAKTTVARLFARIMKENGLLSKGQLVEVGRGDLVGKYVGWTAKIVKEKFKAAMGGVLFIDEAYSLVDDRGGSFGDEAINTIVQEMENHRDDLVVIFAGYPDEMRGFLDKNPGLRSRIAFHVPFADYDAAELCDIARAIGKEKGVTLTDGAITKLLPLFDVARQQPDFGNGRYVRNVIELSKMNQAARILTVDPDKVTDSMLVSLEASDIEVPAFSAAPKKRSIGFAS